MKFPIQLLTRLSDDERRTLLAHSPPPSNANGILVAWASETGQAERLAYVCLKRLQQNHSCVYAACFNTLSTQALGHYTTAVFITSTWGDGDPPSCGEALVNELKTSPTPLLQTLRYSVCALGDSAYPQFCQCGKDVDFHLERLGANRIAPLALCDVDAEPMFEAWFNVLQQQLGTVPKAHT